MRGLSNRKLQLFISVMIVALILYLRKPWGFVSPTLIGEDATAYFITAFHTGFASLTFPYEGFYYTVPRFIAYAVSYADPLYAPIFYSYISFIFLLLILRFLFSERINLSYRPLLALLIVLGPGSASVFFNLKDLHMLLALGVILISCYEVPRNPLTRFFEHVFVLLAGLTGPFSLATFPLFIVKYARERCLHNGMFLVIFVVCILTQLPEFSAAGSFSLDLYDHSLIDNFSKFFSYLILGPKYELLPKYFGQSLVFFIGLAFLLLLLRISIKIHEWQLFNFVFSAVCILIILLFGFTDLTKRGAELTVIEIASIYYLPIVLILWSMVIGFQKLPAVMLPTMVAILIHFVGFSFLFKDTVPKDLNWKAHAQCIRTQDFCTVPVNPVPTTIYVKSENKRL